MSFISLGTRFACRGRLTRALQPLRRRLLWIKKHVSRPITTRRLPEHSRTGTVAARAGGDVPPGPKLPEDGERAFAQFSRVVPLIGLCLIVVMVVIAGSVIRDMRERTEEGYRQEIADLGTALSEQTYRYIQEVDPTLREIQIQITNSKVRTPDEMRTLFGTVVVNGQLKDHLRNMAQVNSLIIIDAEGQSINSSRDYPVPRIDASDRDFYSHFVDKNDQAIFISAPTTSRVDGTSTVFVARQLTAADGRFLGVVAGMLDMAYLNEFYRTISTKAGRSVTLLRGDGLVLTRYPDPTSETGTWMPLQSPWYKIVALKGGFYHSPGFLGGQPALVSVNPLRAYPLVIDVSLKESVEMDSWRRQVWHLGFAGGAAVAGFILLFWFITALFRRQETQNIRLLATADALRNSEHALQTTLNHMDQGLMMIAADDTVAICNSRAIDLLEFTRTDANLQEFIRRAALTDGPACYDRERPNGSFLEVRTTPLPGGKAVRTYTDITDRKLAEKRVDFLAHHDGLTGLPNRVLLNDRLSQALAQTRRSDRTVAALTLGFGRFKEISDMFGHDAGDRILVQATERLRGAIRDADTVARTGRDEFVVIQCDVSQPGSAVELAQRLVDLLSMPFDIGPTSVVLDASVGIALSPGDADTADDLLKNSDIALYRAKAEGRRTCRLFEAAMDREVTERRSIEHDLRLAIGTEQLQLYFQPQFGSQTKTITGFEALLRWNHPTRGSIPPGVMIAIAESSELILELGGWVLEAACAAAITWSVPHRVAVNLSAAQFRNANLPGLIEDVLRRTGLPGFRLELEVTESLLIDSAELALTALRSIKRMGVSFALDDFGTGYSSLSYLRLFPFDKIKIDRSFIQGLGSDPCALSIVEAILAMGQSLDISVIAEGIENEQQLKILQGLRCAEVQGFLLGRPIPSERVDQFISAAVSAVTGTLL
jgi:diguanylate cyclase (GGDEF)-like protein